MDEHSCRVRMAADPDIIVPAGVRLTCPRCRKTMATALCDILRTRSFGLDQFRFAAGQVRDGGNPAACKDCGVGYIVLDVSATDGDSYRAHTEYGWLSAAPLDPKEYVRTA